MIRSKRMKCRGKSKFWAWFWTTRWPIIPTLQKTTKKPKTSRNSSPEPQNYVYCSGGADHFVYGKHIMGIGHAQLEKSEPSNIYAVQRGFAQNFASPIARYSWTQHWCWPGYCLSALDYSRQPPCLKLGEDCPGCSWETRNWTYGGHCRDTISVSASRVDFRKLLLLKHRSTTSTDRRWKFIR